MIGQVELSGRVAFLEARQLADVDAHDRFYLLVSVFVWVVRRRCYVDRGGDFFIFIG